MVARNGYPRIDERTGDNFLSLEDGNLYEGTPGNAGYRIVNFKVFHMRIEPKLVATEPTRIEEIPSTQLYRQDDPKTSAEWHWRISKPIMAMVLVIFALVLAYTEPRRGRLMNMFAAVLVYFFYSNLLALGQTLIKKGHMPGAMGLWWVHALMLIIGLHLLRQRSGNKPLLALPKFRRRRR